MEMSKLSENEIVAIVQKAFPELEISGKPEQLSGGNLNHVWRLKTDKKSLIIKHAPPFIASQPELPLDSERIHFEAIALRLFSGDGDLTHLSTDTIRPPEILFFDQPNALIVMEDVGKFDPLGRFISKDYESETIGNRLGEFIGKLHAETYQKKQFQELCDNKAIQQTRAEVQYNRAKKYADVPFIANITLKEVGKRTQELGRNLLKPGKCLVMGDVWPPSVLTDKTNRLRLIDWEFAHFGRPLQDFAHFAAHCFMKEITSENPSEAKKWRDLFRSFWQSYRKAAGKCFSKLVNEREIKDAHIHMGAEILVRVNGPFRKGYVYDEMPDEHPVWKRSVKEAVDLIVGEHDFFTFNSP